jgi:hypothetical protein
MTWSEPTNSGFCSWRVRITKSPALNPFVLASLLAVVSVEGTRHRAEISAKTEIEDEKPINYRLQLFPIPI